MLFGVETVHIFWVFQRIWFLHFPEHIPHIFIYRLNWYVSSLYDVMNIRCKMCLKWISNNFKIMSCWFRVGKISNKNMVIDTLLTFFFPYPDRFSKCKYSMLFLSDSYEHLFTRFWTAELTKWTNFTQSNHEMICGNSV